LPEEQRPRVTLSTEYAGRTYGWEGRIIRTEAEVDLKSRMVNLVARIDNNAQETPLSIGMYVEAEIEGLLAPDIVVLPRSSLRNGNRVLVIDEQNRLQYREVELLRLYRDEVLIKTGLQADERVCLSAIQTVVEGMPVNPIIEEEQGG
jgi:multidrug efflux pump subunit AcrA (membrane-fusion protein)